MKECFDAAMAAAVLRGQVPDARFTGAIQHAARCESCRKMLLDVARPEVEIEPRTVHDIQERLRKWCMGQRAPSLFGTTLNKGEVVDGYVIVRRVGETEDGCIYEAFDSERERRVVLKQLDLKATDPAAGPLIAATQRLMKLDHPNLLPVLWIGDYRGQLHIAYDLVKGRSLSSVTPKSTAETIALFAQAARGLAAAHLAGVAHGCFSPASCIVDHSGTVRVQGFAIADALAARAMPAEEPKPRRAPSQSDTDFGPEHSFIGYIAQIVGDAGETLVLSASPTTLGARMYTAPERLRGAEASAKADQFSFCAALFRRVYGDAPFAGDTVAVWLRRVLKGSVTIPAHSPPTTGDVPPGVRAALLRGLRAEPSTRFSEMTELVGELDRRSPRWSRRWTVGAIAGGALVTLVAIGGVMHASSSACESDAKSSLDAQWSQSQQDQLAQTFTKHEAAEQWPLTRERIDQYVARWRNAAPQVCSLPAARRTDCLELARGALADAMQAIDHDETSRLVRAPAAIDALPDPSGCTEPGVHVAWPAAATAVAVRRELGMLDEAAKVIPAAPQPSSYTLLATGLVANDRGERTDAAQKFTKAAFAAQAAHETSVMVEAAIQRLALTCSASSRALWKGYVEAELSISGAMSAFRDELDTALADSLACEGRVTEALPLRERVAEHRGAEPTPQSAAADVALAKAVLDAGAPAARAYAAAARAVETYRKLLGPRHPKTYSAMVALADADVAAGALDDADTTLAQVKKGTTDGVVRAGMILVASRAARARGNTEEAIRLAIDAGREHEVALGGAHADLATTLIETGDLQIEVERDTEAEASYRQAIAILEVLGQSESAQMTHARAGAQLARFGGHPPADALELLHIQLAPVDAELDPSVDGWVAEALAARTGDRVRVRALLEAAAEAWKKAGNPRQQASALARAALVDVGHGSADATRELLEKALPLAEQQPIPERPRVRIALAKLLWASRTERPRAKTLATAAAGELADGSTELRELRAWMHSVGAE